MGFTFVLFAIAILWALPQAIPRSTWLLGAAVAPAAFVTLFAGQTGFLTAALFVAGMVTLRKHPLWAGVFFGLLTIKPQLGVALPVLLIAMREPRPLLGALLGFGALAAIGTLFTGLDGWARYLESVVPYQREILETHEGSFRQMMPSVFIATRNLGAGIDIAYLTQAASALIALVLLYRALRSTQDHDLRIALTAAATFLITPYAFNYDLPLLTAALFVGGLVVVAARFDRPTRLVYGLVWLLPILALPANTLGIPLGPLLLWALFVQLTRLAASATDRPAAHARLAERVPYAQHEWTPDSVARTG